MIYTLFLHIRDTLKAKGVPFEVVYGPKPVPLGVGSSRVQVLRDYDASEQIGAPRGRFANPRMLGLRAVPAVVRIFAKATVGGAGPQDHERLADAIADQCHVEIRKGSSAIASVPAVFTFAGLVSDLEVPDGWAGAVYELKFTMDRGVRDTNWSEGASSEFTLLATTTKTALDVSHGPAGTAGELPAATTRIDL